MSALNDKKPASDHRVVIEVASPATIPPSIVAEPRSFLRRHGGKTAASLVIAVAFALLLRRGGLPLLPGKALAQVRWSWVGLHVALLITLHVLRAVRWRHLLRPIAPDIRTRRILAASWIGFTAILILPLRAGEFVRPWLIRDGKRSDSSKPRITLANGLGTMGAERVIDGLMVTAVLAFALVFVPRLSPLPTSFGDLKIPVAAIPAAGYAALIVFVCAFVAMAVFYFARAFAKRLVHNTIGRISPQIGERVAAIVEGIADGLHFLAGPRFALPFLGETLLYWGLNALGMWVLGVACGLPMHFGHACAVMGVLAVGILVPAGPGLFGAFQAATYGALAMYFPYAMVVDQGASYVFLLYGIQFVWHLLAAGIAGFLEPSMLRREEPSE